MEAEMKNQLIALLMIVAASINCYSFTETINTSLLMIKKADVKLSHQTFDGFSSNDFLMSKNIGQPSLPSRSYLLAAEPEDIQINIEINNPTKYSGVRLAPATPEKCRCIDDLLSTRHQFTFSEKTYLTPQAQVTKSYLGKYRGTPITKVDVKLVNYDASQLLLTTYESVKISTRSAQFSFPKISDKAISRNFLVVIPSGWESAISDFVDYKASMGYNMIVETVSAPNNTKEALQQKIKALYDAGNLIFTMIVGDENTIPMFSLDTSGSTMTPSDLPYFTMDGNTDHIPDVFASRISARNSASVKDQLAKIIDQEKLNLGSFGHRKNVIGIASGEGYNPSDAEYITAIDNSLNEKWGGEVTYLYENNQDSNATNLNAAINNGAFWLTYIGHGSGYAWPSMYDYYSTSDVANINNSATTKPVIIDVACQNGRLAVDHLGSQFMNPKQNREASNGAAAYYGGSVNISWHPPAIMARGIAFEHMAKNFNYLGEALLAGQIYLANNWESTEDIIDNMEWYHLQGDPSYSIHY